LQRLFAGTFWGTAGINVRWLLSMNHSGSKAARRATGRLRAV